MGTGDGSIGTKEDRRVMTLAQTIRDRLEVGRVPRGPFKRVIAVGGGDFVCAACGAEHQAGPHLVGKPKDSVGLFAFHADCFEIWKRETAG
jgi:hypothetical protein